MMKKKYIAVDFDGTCCTHEYPDIGQNIGAVPVLLKLQEKGHKIILFTMRSGKELEEAADWLEIQGVSLFSLNENPTQKSWTQSPKPYAHVYIDDAALGCPLTFNEEVSARPYVDWKAVEALLTERGIL